MGQKTISTWKATIHNLNATEWRRGRDIRLKALADCPDAFGSTLERERQFTDVDWRRRLENPDAITMVAVEHPGADVGLIVGGPYGEFAGLFSMWIDPAWRRRGIGGCLVDAVVDWARQLGKRKLLLDVGDWNTGAIALYRSRGFEPTGQVGTLPFPRDHIPETQLALLL